MTQGLMRGLAKLAVALTAAPIAPFLHTDGSRAPPPTREIDLVADKTTVVRLEPGPGQPWEQHPLFTSRVPSYRRGVVLDGEQRWLEAAGAYQQALIEVGQAAGLDDAPLWEQAAFKIDLERRRSHALARGETGAGAGAGTERIPVGGGPSRASKSSVSGPAAVERGRLLRLKLMSVRAATDAVPQALGSATLFALRSAFAQPPTRDAHTDTGDPEVRLLLCATRAAIGDRAGARWELAHVAPSIRSEPTRALALASCQAALGDDENALASLAVGVYRLGPSSRFLPGQTRELQSANDWDALRGDPRFELIFR